MNTLKYLLLCLPLIFISCQEESNPAIYELDYGYLMKSWTNSYEEEIAASLTKIFRPSNYKEYPSSWYREILKFSQDGTCSYLVLASNDAHYFENGKWVIVDGAKRIISILKQSGAPYKKIQIVELKQDILKFVLVD